MDDNRPVSGCGCPTGPWGTTATHSTVGKSWFLHELGSYSFNYGCVGVGDGSRGVCGFKIRKLSRSSRHSKPSFNCLGALDLPNSSWMRDLGCQLCVAMGQFYPDTIQLHDRDPGLLGIVDCHGTSSDRFADHCVSTYFSNARLATNKDSTKFRSKY